MSSHESAERLVSAQNKITGWREKARGIAHGLPAEYGEVYAQNENQYISLLLEAALASESEVANGSAISDGVKDTYVDLTNSYLSSQVIAFKAEVIAADSSEASIPLFYVARILMGEVTLRQDEERRQREGQRRREEQERRQQEERRRREEAERKRQAEERERQEKERQRQIEGEKRRENRGEIVAFCIMLGISCLGLTGGIFAMFMILLGTPLGIFIASSELLFRSNKTTALWVVCHITIQIISMVVHF